MAQAGIPQEDWDEADYIITRESGWNPTAMNPSGACGLPQALPCSKLGPEWHNPHVALVWSNQYAIARYGSWKNAKAHWERKGWW